MAVYLDHAATTPMLPEALSAYAAATAAVGNPASIHRAGQGARLVLEEAREAIATTLGCDPIEVVLTGGGTEAINLAIKGLYWAARRRDARRRRILVPDGEHHATIDTAQWLARDQDAVVQWLPLLRDGRIDVAALAAALAGDASDVALVTCLAANNEVGTRQPVAQIAALAADAGVPLHVDAVAAYGHVPLDFRALRGAAVGNTGLVAMSVSAHKVGGPVGSGALVLSRAAAVSPLLHGGGQQRDVRSGTQDVAAAAAFAAAARAAARDLAAEAARVSGLRERVIAGVRAIAPDAVLSGPDPALHPHRALPGTAHFVFPGAQGDSLLYLLDARGVCVSTGSACQAGIPEPSHVLIAMGRSEQDARSAVRITLGRTSTAADVQALLDALPDAYRQARAAGLSDRETALGAR